jgi:glucosylceramidase
MSEGGNQHTPANRLKEAGMHPEPKPPFRKSSSLMRSNRLLHVACAVATGALVLCTTPLRAGEVTVIVTKVDDGEAKHAPYGVHQDDDLTLFRQGSLPLTAADPGLPVKIAVDRTRTFQTMYGYGAAMTDSSAWVLMNLKRRSPQLYEYTMKRLFSPTEGAGFSVLRLPIGASDYTVSPTYYTYCDQWSPDLSRFSIAHDRPYIIPVLKDALQMNPEIRILGTPWSPPAWMKTSGRLVSIPEAAKAAGATCKLKPQCFEMYANYLVKFIEQYRAEGIEIWGITLQNEPQFDLGHWPGMRMDEEDQIRLASLLGPKLAAKGLKTKLFVHDHNWGLHPNDRKVIRGDAKMDPLESVTKILSDPTASKYIAGSAWHCYYGGPALMARTYNTIHQRFPDKDILCTELSGWKRGSWWGDVDYGMAHNWMGAPQNWCQMCLEWNLALNCRYAGLVNIETETYQGVRFEREFYAMGQMSRAARPGSKRIAASFKGADRGGMDIIAFALPDGQTSLVVYNKEQMEQSFQVEANGKFFDYPAHGHSIVTFIW